MTPIILIFLGAFCITIFIIPHVIKIVKQKRLQDEPNNRAVHKKRIPTMGGVAIFCSLFISLLLIGNDGLTQQWNHLLCGLFLIFLVGLTDDLIDLSPINKLLGQSIVAILIVSSGIQISSLHGFLGITTLPILLSYFLTFGFILFLINAVNLIDGIDGLAGSLGLLSSILFGIWFYLIGDVQFSLMAFALAGSLLGFLQFNMAPARIFMGDTGSLILGYFIAIFSIHFLEIHPNVTDTSFTFSNHLALGLSIIFIPFFDTIRIFLTRILKGNSPFQADKNHVHHLLLRIGFNHLEATSILVGVNLLFILFTIFFQELPMNQLIAMQFVVGIVFIIPLTRKAKYKTKSTKKSKKEAVFPAIPKEVPNISSARS